MSKSQIDIAVGLNLCAMRKDAGLSLETLADKLPRQITYQQLQKYEKGINRVSAGLLFELARVFGCSVLDFYANLDEHITPVGHQAIPGESLLVQNWRKLGNDERVHINNIVQDLTNHLKS